MQQAGIAAPPIYIQETGSTSSDAKLLADRGAPEWTIVATGHQTAGRGRLGRSWASAPGKALQFSLLLRPALPPNDAPLAALLAAVEMGRSCQDVAGLRVASKWPNDLLAGGRKVGGILPEAKVSGGALDHLILGIGVNVSMGAIDFPEGIRDSATSLAMEGAAVEVPALLGWFLSGFRDSWRPADPDFAGSVVRRYRPVCVTLGRRVRATTTDGVVVEGVASDLDEHGGLRVGDATIGFGEVVHLD